MQRKLSEPPLAKISGKTIKSDAGTKLGPKPATKEVAMIERRELSQENIAHRAYELYIRRGSQSGKDVEDWLRAEKQLVTEVGSTPERALAAVRN